MRQAYHKAVRLARNTSMKPEAIPSGEERLIPLTKPGVIAQYPMQHEARKKKQ